MFRQWYFARVGAKLCVARQSNWRLSARATLFTAPAKIGIIVQVRAALCLAAFSAPGK